jgi:hypothetical protein
MEPESLLPYSQEPAIGLYPKPGESNPHSQTYFPKIHFNIILPSTPRSSEWSLPSRLANQNFVRIFRLPEDLFLNINGRLGRLNFITLLWTRFIMLR